MKWLPFLLTASTAVSSATAIPAEDLHPPVGSRVVISQTAAVTSTDGPVDFFQKLEGYTKAQTLLEQQIAAQKAELARSAQIDATIKRLRTHVGRTPYVFSGITPQGWDCSGLTLWFYDQALGIKLEHSAREQAALGQKVDAPKPGDIVAFYYTGRKTPYHVGIYIGNDMFIHAPKPDHRTSLDNVYTWTNNTKVAFIRY